MKNSHHYLCCQVLASMSAGQSVDHHFLTSYHHAILSIILAQFSPKGLPGGMLGIIKLAQASPYLKVTSPPSCSRTHAATDCCCMRIGSHNDGHCKVMLMVGWHLRLHATLHEATARL